MRSSASATELNRLVQGYKLCAQTEGKSKSTIQIVTSSVGYLRNFLESEGLSTDATKIGPDEIRAFILYLQHKRQFSGHPFLRAQREGLSAHTINSYLRSIRAFWSWIVGEEIITENPFLRVKIPKAPHKVIPTLSPTQIQMLLGTIDTTSAEGFRDYVVVLTLLDTGLRISEFLGLRLDDLWIEEGVLKVMGKGSRERIIPIGKGVRRLLWRYINLFRPESAKPNCDLVFLTKRGWPLTKGRVQKRMSLYAGRAGLSGVRCSPHILRHTAAVSFLRNGGDVFSLQRLLGHSTLLMTRHYCELADIDVRRAHATASPVDNLITGPGMAKEQSSSRSSRGGPHSKRLQLPINKWQL